MTLPAGKYFIGDLCYVLEADDEWDEVCDLTISGNKNLDGEFILKDGRRFAMYGTAYGDGVYDDNYGNSYPVDSGTIGCILMSDIPTIDEERASKMGAIVEFHGEFTTFVQGGTLAFGHIRIDTDFEDPVDYDE